jgi:N-acyl-D-amino-acid deacylase
MAIRRSLLILLLGITLAPAYTIAPSPPGADHRLAPLAPSLLVRNGTLVDGTGAPRRKADVRITGDRLALIGDRLTPRPGERVIDARGKIVAPGFIDTHSHADGGIFETPDAESHIRQGITTAIVGQDGGSRIPLQGFFDELREKPAALNFASFVGHGAVRRRVMGADYKRPARPEEIAAMARLVEEEMRSGALGLSSGLEYDPGFYATTEELIACAKPAARHGGIYISHVRDEANAVFPSFEELIRIAREARLPAQISHIKLGAASVWGKADNALRLIDAANRRGLDITADVYPYLYWTSSSIAVLVPSRDWESRASCEKGLADVGGPQNVCLVTYTPDPTWERKTIAEIATMTGKDPVTVIQEVIRATSGEAARGSGRVVVTAMTEPDLRRFLAAPRVMFCTDGGLRTPHPRAAGTYPRILARYVRDQRVLPLEEAIRKMTSFPAKRMGFRDRGILRPGMKADLVIFDLWKLRDRATPADPTALSEGVTHVFVNGVPVLEDGKMTGARPGVGIRRGEPTAVQGARVGVRGRVPFTKAAMARSMLQSK